MLIPDYNTDKFLYKVKKWGGINQDICLLLYTDHTKNEERVYPYCFSIILVVHEYLRYTKKLNWLEFFGKTRDYKITHTEENSIIEVDYENGLIVKFVIVASNIKESCEKYGGLGPLMNKKHDK
ncbi:hypothetical protein D9O36_16390 [Zobellia amurskyensis]|uniref:Uncharacterized protein n=1 Tax=Zobellia amurskyensis TaxID=248905 RepID=A0A7X2ZVZ8_9FLAO|nr:hypothetical protein [Zobellia amurskyensis]MUH37433.1 hypothetical protein [Zobellia amurskyensis]